MTLIFNTMTLIFDTMTLIFNTMTLIFNTMILICLIYNLFDNWGVWLSTLAGEIMVLGTGDCGQLGLGVDSDRNMLSKWPRPLTIFTDKFKVRITSIACGGLHTVAISSQGRVFTWGCNDEQALGR